MTSSSAVPTKSGSLQLFFFGPGIGESIVLRLPDGQWGVVDFFEGPKNRQNGIIDFLTTQKVDKLAFFCLTHPHEDHYLGANRLLARYRGRVGRIWRYSGLSSRELQIAAATAALVKARRTGDPEANALADNFMEVIAAIKSFRQDLAPSNYVRVIAPLSLLKTSSYEISAVRPTTVSNEIVEEKLRSKNTAEGYLIFNDEEGGLLNSLSVVLRIDFDNARVILLGDAQGSTEAMDATNTKFSIVKIAHHGSANGLGVDRLNVRPRSPQDIACGVITPYLRSRLPAKDMVKRYSAVTDHLFVTGGVSSGRPRTVAPGLQNARLATNEAGWVGLEIFGNGEVQHIKVPNRSAVTNI